MDSLSRKCQRKLIENDVKPHLTSDVNKVSRDDVSKWRKCIIRCMRLKYSRIFLYSFANSVLQRVLYTKVLNITVSCLDVFMPRIKYIEKSLSNINASVVLRLRQCRRKVRILQTLWSICRVLWKTIFRAMIGIFIICLCEFTHERSTKLSEFYFWRLCEDTSKINSYFCWKKFHFFTEKK